MNYNKNESRIRLRREAVVTVSTVTCDYMEDITQNLKDAGCDADKISEIRRLYDGGQMQDAIKVLRRQRCALMDDLHESQSRVDCLDYLVSKMEKEKEYY